MASALLALLVLAPLLQAVPLGAGFSGATLADVLAAGVCLVLLLDRSWLRAVDIRSVGALLLTAGWVTASGSWGAAPGYAFAKGLAVLGWGGVALGLAGSGLSLRRVARAWCVGALLLLLASLALAWVRPALGLYWGGASIGGLPRLRGVLGHPNLLGDYLTVSLILMVGLWAGGQDPPRLRAGALAGLILATAVALAGTVTTAWMGVGVALAVAGWRMPPTRWGRGRRAALIACGAGLAATTAAGALRPIHLGTDDVPVVTSGVRPAIWASAAWAPRLSPLRGVGAAPYLAEAVDPFAPGDRMLLWDAHSTPLSILGQFGVIGALLYLWLAAELLGIADRIRLRAGDRRGHKPALRLLPSPRTQVEAAVWLALLAAAVHSLVTASEDFRHLWLLLGLGGLSGRAGRGSSEAGTVDSFSDMTPVDSNLLSQSTAARAHGDLTEPPLGQESV